MDKVQKSSKAARGTVTCDNTTMHLLKANDFVAQSICSKMAAKNTLLIYVTSSAGSGKNINSNIGVMEISSIQNLGIDEWCQWLLEKVKEKQNAITAINA